MLNSLISRMVLVMVLMCPASAYSQCNYTAYVDSCKTHITHDHFNFLKEFEVDNQDGQKEKVEFSITLAEGFDYEYYFTGLKEGHQEVTATLYDYNRQKLVTNKHHRKLVHVISYSCQKTGIYYITFTFKDEEKYCGAAVLGFVKQ